MKASFVCALQGAGKRPNHSISIRFALIQQLFDDHAYTFALRIGAPGQIFQRQVDDGVSPATGASDLYRFVMTALHT
ncbi:MAG: hypothetical protein VR64_22155 [Desulfatitalea sp. BRH_c12]|nr:MAG: hypothetical protein VR64_22155 [Desulfatitalea sp. BRH_c12]